MSLNAIPFRPDPQDEAAPSPIRIEKSPQSTVKQGVVTLTAVRPCPKSYLGLSSPDVWDDVGWFARPSIPTFTEF